MATEKSQKIVGMDNQQVELDIVRPTDIDLNQIPDINELFSPQELRVDALQGSDYIDTPIYVHDFEIITVEGERGRFPMVVMSVVIPDANEYGTMHCSAWGVVKVFQGIEKMNRFEPCFISFIEIPSGKGNPTYRIRTKEDK